MQLIDVPTKSQESVLGYRSFLRVNDFPDLRERVDQQLYSWLRHKKWNPDRLLPGTVVELTAGVQATQLVLEHQDGSSTVRSRFDETNPSGRWLTQVTYHQDGKGDGWVWVDIRHPSGARPAVPRLVRDLVDVLDARDGSCPATPEAHVVDSVEARNLIGWITDPRRRGLVFVAGSSEELPLPRWRDYVGGILRQTVGIASAFVLDPAATEWFNKQVGPGFAVPPGALRTFAPGLDLDDSSSSVRHKVLSTNRIISDDQHRLRGLLGNRAKEASRLAPLPPKASRLDLRLREEFDALLIASAIHPHATSGTEAAPSVQEQQTPDDRPTDTYGDPSLVDALTSAVRSVWGAARLATADSIRELATLASEQLASRRSTDILARRIQQLELTSEAALSELEELRTQLDDEKVETELLDSERRGLDAEVLRLRTTLSEAGLAHIAWDVPSVQIENTYPADFEELLTLWDVELRHIEFTGDTAPPLDLYEADPYGTWAKKTWDALCALDDYAELKKSEGFAGGVHQYLAATPSGCRGFSINNFAADESDTVKRTPKFRTPRVLPVPPSVDPSGTVFMGAHVKIAKSGQVSPRVHLFDDVDRTGKIYVGYIGRHLPNTMTS